jgi:hypothetical protein
VYDQESGLYETQRHSGLGIASFVLSVGVGLLLFCTFAVAGVMQNSAPGGMNEKAPAVILIGLAIIGLVLLDVIAFGLGIAGFFQRNRSKVFAILGTIFSSLVILATVLLIVAGTMMRAR